MRQGGTGSTTKWPIRLVGNLMGLIPPKHNLYKSMLYLDILHLAHRNLPGNAGCRDSAHRSGNKAVGAAVERPLTSPDVREGDTRMARRLRAIVAALVVGVAPQAVACTV